MSTFTIFPGAFSFYVASTDASNGDVTGASLDGTSPAETTAPATSSGASYSSPQVMLYSTFSWGGITGNCTFSYMVQGGRNLTQVEVSLEEVSPSTQDPVQYQWAVHEWPVRYDTNKRCSSEHTGKMCDSQLFVFPIYTRLTQSLRK